jgi:hypothetical protein
MIGGLIGNLLVLPLLIQFMDRSDDTDADIAHEQRIDPPRSHVADVDHTRVNGDRVQL